MDKIFDFLQKIESLKTVKRYCVKSDGGWESSAEHSWRLALFTMLVAKDFGVDSVKAVKLALVHDIVESIAGDTNYCDVHDGNVSLDDKALKEKQAISQLKELLGGVKGHEIFDLWNEYEDGVSREAKFVKALDKLETTLQLVDGGFKNFSDEYFHIIPNYPDKAVKNFPDLLPFLKIVKDKVRKEFEKGNLEWKSEYDL